MDAQIWVALIGGSLALAGAMGVRLLTLRQERRRIEAQTEQSQAEAGARKAESAEVLARAYSVLVDDMRRDLDRQDREIAELRKELRAVVETRDKEIAALREELATERAENSRLRARVEELERQVSHLPRRHDDAETVDNSDAT